MKSKNKVTLVYDARCRMCSAGAAWLLAHADPKKIRFVPLQTDAGSAMLRTAGLNQHNPQTILVVTDHMMLLNSQAVLYLLKMGGGAWGALAEMLYLVPPDWLDKLYAWVAARRHRWFARTKACTIIGSHH
jgi:predicted DCC family thiol-disulfide oxidoreductase YuxK